MIEMFAQQQQHTSLIKNYKRKSLPPSFCSHPNNNHNNDSLFCIYFSFFPEHRYLANMTPTPHGCCFFFLLFLLYFLSPALYPHASTTTSTGTFPLSLLSSSFIPTRLPIVRRLDHNGHNKHTDTHTHVHRPLSLFICVYAQPPHFYLGQPPQHTHTHHQSLP